LIPFQPPTMWQGFTPWIKAEFKYLKRVISTLPTDRFRDLMDCECDRAFVRVRKLDKPLPTDRFRDLMDCECDRAFVRVRKLDKPRVPWSVATSNSP